MGAPARQVIQYLTKFKGCKDGFVHCSVNPTKSAGLNGIMGSVLRGCSSTVTFLLSLSRLVTILDEAN